MNFKNKAKVQSLINILNSANSDIFRKFYVHYYFQIEINYDNFLYIKNMFCVEFRKKNFIRNCNIFLKKNITSNKVNR